MHTGPQEHNHIENAKRPSERMQKHKATYDLQIANCLVDRYVIDYTHSRILNQQSQIIQYEELQDSNEINDSTQYAAKFKVNMVHNPVTKKN